jgi:hypothetical protein
VRHEIKEKKSTDIVNECKHKEETRREEDASSRLTRL